MPYKNLLLVITLFFCTYSVMNAQIDYSQVIILRSTQNSFENLLAEVSETTKVQFSYSSAVVEPNSLVLLKKNRYTLGDFLDEISAILYIQYIEFNDKVLFVEMKEKWEDFWMYGYIRDFSSGEVIIGAVVYNMTDRSGTLSNEFGYFSIKIQSPNSNIKVSSLAYRSDTIYAARSDQKRMDVNLVPRYTIPTIIVTPSDSIDSKYYIEEVFDKTAENINPSLFGERDILQSIKYLPGIQSGSEVQGNILVRGGSSDQNLMLMDGVPIYETNHLLGLSSIFNDAVINDIDVSTSSFSSKYGGRLSSIIDVHIKNGNKFKYSGSASLGLLGAKFHAEGPINKGKTSFNMAFRTSYINQIVKPLASRFLNVEDTRFSYSDMNVKFHHQLTKNNSFSINTYVGGDVIGFGTKIVNESEPDIEALSSTNRISWSNNLVNFRFDQIVNRKLFFNISASTVNYNLRSRSSNIYRNFNEEQELEVNEVDIFANSKINDNNLKTDWEYKENNDHVIKFGLGISRHVYNPTVISQKFIDVNSAPNPQLGIVGREQFFYLEDNYDVSPYLSFVTGFHFSQFKVEEEFFSSFQPRLSMNLNFDPKNDLSFSYSKMTQFVHLLVNPGTGLPSDLWLPATGRIPPEESIQFSTKYTRIWNDRIITYFSAYYKTFENLIEYRSAFPLYNPIINGATVFQIFENARDWEDRVEVGNGNAQGLEFFSSYNTNKWLANLSYSFSVSNREFENINGGEEFPFRFDRRHDLSISSTYNYTENLSFGMNWVYGSGHAITFSTTQFKTVSGEIIFDNGDRNAFRLPNYHRLDLNVKYSRPLNKNFRMETIFGIYNVYNRLNPYLVYLYQDIENDEFSARQVGLFPILPFLNVSLKY